MSIVCARLQKKLNPFFSLDGKQDFRHFYLQTATNNLWFQDFLIFKQTTFTMQRKTQTKILKPLVLRKLYGCIFFLFHLSKFIFPPTIKSVGGFFTYQSL